MQSVVLSTNHFENFINHTQDLSSPPKIYIPMYSRMFSYHLAPYAISLDPFLHYTLVKCKWWLKFKMIFKNIHIYSSLLCHLKLSYSTFSSKKHFQ